MEQHRKWTDEEILNTFYASSEGKERAMAYIYNESGWRKQVIKHVLKNSGTFEDAEDVMNEALLDFKKNLEKGSYKGKSALQGYFFGIMKNKWSDVLRERKKQKEMTEKNDSRQNTPSENNADKRLLEEDRRKRLNEMAKKLGFERCIQLHLEARAGASGAELARQFGFRDPDAVKKFKSDCWKAFKEKLKTIPGWRNLLSDELMD